MIRQDDLEEFLATGNPKLIEVWGISVNAVPDYDRTEAWYNIVNWGCKPEVLASKIQELHVEISNGYKVIDNMLHDLGEAESSLAVLREKYKSLVTKAKKDALV